MPENIKKLIADLQHVVEQISAENGKQEGQPQKAESSAQADTAVSNNNPDQEKIGEGNDLQIEGKGEGLAIGLDVDKNGAMKLERIEVIPEPDECVRIMVSAKKEQPR
jgi:hypothetical protein